MYNKIKKALDTMAYNYKEYDCVRFSNGVVIRNPLLIEKSYNKKVYVNISDGGEIDVWTECGKYLFTVYKKEMFLMMFELGTILGD